MGLRVPQEPPARARAGRKPRQAHVPGLGVREEAERRFALGQLLLKNRDPAAQPRLERRRRGLLRKRPCEERQGVARLADPLHADDTPLREVGLEPSALVLVERAERIDLGLLEPDLVAHDTLAPLAEPRKPRSRSSPVRIRVFTVPSGSPSRVAISDWVRPSK